MWQCQLRSENEHSRPTTLIPRLAGAFGATLILDLDTDEILAATPQAHTLLKDTSLVGSRFSQLAADDVPQMILFVDEVIHRGEAWTRRITLRTRENDRINCEINARSEGRTLLLQITDLAALERRAEAVQAATHL